MRWLRRHPILGFLGFSHGWTFVWWGLAGALAQAGDGTVWAGPAAVAFYIGGAGVFIGGVAMTALHSGLPGLAELGAGSWTPVPLLPSGGA